jgi:FtsP/CotA-like multicopper oxidase with cupredoxin domain
MLRPGPGMVWLLAAVTGLSGCASAAPVPSSLATSPAPGGQVREFYLSAAVSGWQLSGDASIQAWAFNGQVPGPPLVVREGDLVKVDVINNLPRPTSVHWHGVAVPNAMDGTPDVTQKGIPPGGTFHYEFMAPPTPGTFSTYLRAVNPVVAQLWGDGPDPVTGRPVHRDFFDIVHLNPPSGHCALLAV